MKKNSIIPIVTIIVMISFSFSTVVSLASIGKLIDDNNREESIIYANQISDSIIATFAEPRAVGLSISNAMIEDTVIHLKSYEKDELSDIFGEYLNQVVEDFGYSTAFLVTAEEQAYYTENGFIKNLDYNNPDDDWFENFRDTGKKYELNIDNDQANNNITTVYTNCRMEDDNGKFLGACGVGVNTDVITNLFRESKNLKGYTVLLAENNGNIKLSSKLRNKEIIDKESTYLGKVSPSQLEAIKNYNPDDRYEYVDEKGEGFFIIRYMEECDWYLIVSYDGNRTFASYYDVILYNLIAFIISLAVIVAVTNRFINKADRKSENYKLEAQVDPLTGVFNRRAYQKKFDLLERNGDYRNLTLVDLDINGLKLVNDTAGHDAGDELLISAAEIIKEYFTKFGEVYRVGGDEFVAIVDKEVDDPDAFVDEFKQIISKWQSEKVKTMSISVGIIRAKDHEDMDLNELIRRADKLMYEDKAEFYKSNQHLDRRRER